MRLRCVRRTITNASTTSISISNREGKLCSGSHKLVRDIARTYTLLEFWGDSISTATIGLYKVLTQPALASRLFLKKTTPQPPQVLPTTTQEEKYHLSKVGYRAQGLRLLLVPNFSFNPSYSLPSSQGSEFQTQKSRSEQ